MGKGCRQNAPYARRGLIYLAGLLCLAFGLMLCTKAGLGSTAVISLPFAVSRASGLPLTPVLFANYAVMILLQLLIQKRGLSLREAAQLPLSALNSVVIGWLGNLVHPEFTALWQQIALLLLAIAMVAVGASVTVKMEIVPQPPEGLSQVLSEKLGKDLGFGKNLVDFTCVGAALLTDLVFGGGKLVSVGLGTVLAMILTGRVISLFNHFFAKPIRRLAGLEDNETSNKEETI